MRATSLSGWCFSICLLTRCAGAMGISVTASAQSPAPLGSLVTWTAAVQDEDPGTLSYRFRTRWGGAPFRTVVDFGPAPSFAWTTIAGEGAWEVEAAVKNASTGEVASIRSVFVFTALAAGSGPVVTPRVNPTVYIYSAPACAEGRMHVEFGSGDGIVQSTDAKACVRGRTMNFYLAGMRPGAQYTARHVVSTRTVSKTGPAIAFTTGSVTVTSPSTAVVTTPMGGVEGGLLLQSLFYNPTIATDLNGNIVWYSPADVSYLTRPLDGGTFLGLGEDGTKDASYQFMREFDLAGVTVAQTNAARVNEQLASMGVHPINGFHHEARKLPNGNYLVLAASERMLTDVQGPGAVDVVGDTILVLDRDLNVVWSWDAFDHLDPHKAAPMNEKCNYPSTPACPPIYLARTANDWLHGNSLQLTPDGNILYSVRNQDWIVKIDYQNGGGSGAVLWRLGMGGDFQIQSSDPSPWFSHQHDANFQPNNKSLTVFDDGNQRAAIDPNAHSRGQQLQIDEQNRQATLVLNADLGTYSPAVGSAQALPDGNYHFDSGFISVKDSSGKSLGTVSQSVETDGSGNIVYAIQFGATEYRTFRIPDLYTAP